MVVNPENVFDIARGIKEVLLDPELRFRLTEEGRIQVVASLAHGSACPRSLIQPELNHLRAPFHSDQPSSQARRVGDRRLPSPPDAVTLCYQPSMRSRARETRR